MPLPKDVGFYASADGGYWWLGTSDAFYGTAAFPTGVLYTSYNANIDVGIGFTWKVFTLDFRYYDTNLNKGDCTRSPAGQSVPNMQRWRRFRARVRSGPFVRRSPAWTCGLSVGRQDPGSPA